MHKSRIKQVAALVLLSLALWAIDALRNPEPAAGVAVCREVIDGDTFRIEWDGRLETVRLLGVDTPEMRAGEHLDRQVKHYQCSASRLIDLGRQAREEMETLLDRQEVDIRFRSGREERDRYNRLLAYVEVGGTDAGGRLLEKGLADIFRTTHPRENLYRRLQKSAEDQQLGLWE